MCMLALVISSLTINLIQQDSHRRTDHSRTIQNPNSTSCTRTPLEVLMHATFLNILAPIRMLRVLPFYALECVRHRRSAMR